MSNEKMNQNTTPTYIVKIYFSGTSKETMSDKIKCMLRNEIRRM